MSSHSELKTSQDAHLRAKQIKSLIRSLKQKIKKIEWEGEVPIYLTKSAIAKHRTLTGSGFDQCDRGFPQPTVCCQILS